MSEQNERAAESASLKVSLEDFVEAATRGVLRALEAQEDVSGYAQNLATQQPGLGGINLQPRPGRPIGPIIMGIWYNPTLPGPYAGQLGTSVKPV